ncbi:LacI family DNA-binding transcriptional regulator [Paenibacillus sp. P26]|nr:LacI family DNA-binding transcriptional regulator [Paenibacillus sp. P26]
MATIDDVAKQAGVSKGTVSNVFSKKDRSAGK